MATRGRNVQPRLVTALRDTTTGEVRPIEPIEAPPLEIASPQHWQKAIDGMVAVVRGGTATRSALGATYTMAGKTGTAQVFTVAQNAKYDEKKISDRLWDHAWYIAFAPVENPQIAVAVLVENGRSGSGTAAPIARQVMDAYLAGATKAEAVAVSGGGE
jgi:penicillin-binding protein 2